MVLISNILRMNQVDDAEVVGAEFQLGPSALIIATAENRRSIGPRSDRCRDCRTNPTITKDPDENELGKGSVCARRTGWLMPRVVAGPRQDQLCASETQAADLNFLAA